jgi:hypothetical protein
MYVDAQLFSRSVIQAGRGSRANIAGILLRQGRQQSIVSCSLRVEIGKSEVEVLIIMKYRRLGRRNDGHIVVAPTPR